MNLNHEIDKNLDQAEIDKFDREADTWWDPNGPSAPLHHLNPARLQFICNHVLVTNKNILDIGSGGGILSESLAKKGARVTGIDASPNLIKVAKSHAAENGLSIEYEQITVEEYAEKNSETMDVITCMELLEHVPDPESLIQAAARCVKPGGALFFSTLNRNVKSYLLAILGAEYVLGLLPKHTHQYDKFIRPSELADWCRSAGITPQELRGIKYHPFTKRAELSSDISVNYLVYAVKTFV